jgi:hypothetical protein
MEFLPRRELKERIDAHEFFINEVIDLSPNVLNVDPNPPPGIAADNWIFWTNLDGEYSQGIAKKGNARSTGIDGNPSQEAKDSYGGD